MKVAKVLIEDVPFEFNVEGETFYGGDEILLNGDDNIIKNSPFDKTGYIIQPFLNKDDYKKLQKGITELIKSYLAEAGVTKLEGFSLEHYHKFVRSDDDHTYVVKKINKGVPQKFFPIDIRILDKKISEICGVKVTSDYEKLKLTANTFSIRIVRPSRLLDNNPPHRDVWLDSLRNCVNIYVPIAGSNKQSSLPMMPGSHYWKESEIERSKEGAQINNLSYTVPCVIGSKRDLKMVRPDPKENEVLVFTPYLIHGGGYNINKDITRVSLELRFWRDK